MVPPFSPQCKPLRGFRSRGSDPTAPVDLGNHIGYRPTVASTFGGYGLTNTIAAAGRTASLMVYNLDDCGAIFADGFEFGNTSAWS